jgi:AcrR family transcriptional regulator
MEQAPPRARLSADDRRRQLIGIGLRLLLTQPIHELSIDEVAAEAGISRSLLFHYFPTKRDYHAAVTRAAARRLLRATAVPEDTPPTERLATMVGGLVTFIDRRRGPYVTFVRGSAGGDAWLEEIHEDLRSQLVDAALRARAQARDAVPDPAGTVPDPARAVDPLLRRSVSAWWAYAEEIVLRWTADPPTERVPGRDELVQQIVTALEPLVRLTPGRR